LIGEPRCSVTLLPPLSRRPVEAISADALIPVSNLALDLDEPAGGLVAYLKGRGIEVMTDDIGRPSIARADARQLLDEQREAEARKRAKLAENERRAIEDDRVRRAQIWGGLPAVDLPVGVSAASAMIAADHDAQPKRTTPLQEALAGETMTYHAWPTEEAS
jgi:hypothetical protein